MSKFKVGDKVRVVANNSSHGFEVGSVVTVVETYINVVGVTDGICKYYLSPDEYESNAPALIVVGGEYTSKNGYKWLCIAVDGEYAHMRHADTPPSSAYCFKTDGTNISQGGGDWDVQFEPVREPIEVHGSFNRGFYDYAPDYITHHQQMGEHKFTMSIDMVDGKPDWSSAKLTGA